MRGLRAAFALALMALGVAAPAGSADALEPALADRIRAAADDTFTELGIPGAAVVIVRAGGVVFDHGYGEAGAGREATPQTPFHVASLSKAVTAIAIRQLIEDGALELDTKIQTLLPWFGEDVPQVASLTVRDLLAHASGWTTGDGLANRLDGSSDDAALERNVRRLSATQPSGEIGFFEYSNANYDVLGLVIAAASGMTYESYISDRILGPLGMTHTHLSDAAARGDGLAQGHVPFYGATIAYDIPFVRGSLPSSFIAASADDLGRLLSMLLGGGTIDDATLLAPASAAEVLNPLIDISTDAGYGWGWWRYPLYQAGEMTGDQWAVPVILEHSGSHANYASSMLLLPEAGYGIVVLMNANDEAASSRHYQLGYNLASILLGLEALPLTAYEDALARNWRPIVLAVLALQGAGIAFAVRRFRRYPPLRANGIGFWIAQVLVPLGVDLGVPLLLWGLALDTVGAGLAGAPLIVVHAPDVGPCLVLMLLIGVVWGAVRTAITLRRARAMSIPEARDGLMASGGA